MKKKYEEKRSMCYVVKKYIDNTPSEVLEQMPEFNTVFTQFIAELETIPEESESQTINRTGEAALKNILKLDMVVAAVEVSSRIKAYAANTNNVVLEEQMSKTYSTLSKTADTVCADLCLFIFNKGTQLLPSLGSYGVTEDKLTKLNDKRLAFIAQLPMPRTGIVDRRQATLAIAISMKNLTKYLNKMDTLVEMLRFTKPDFYSAYFSSRKIVRNGHRTLSILGTVVDENGNPLTKVTVSIKDTKLTKKTTVKGSFEFKNLSSNVYDVVLSKAGYENVEVKVAVTATMRSEVQVVMPIDMANPLRIAS